MKFFVLMAIGIILLSADVSKGAEKSHYEAARKYIEITKEEEKNVQMLELIRSSMYKQLETDMSKYSLSEKHKPIFQKYMKRITDVITEELTWEKLHDDFIEIYVEVYSEKELKNLIKFFESPTGKMYIEKEQIALRKRGERSQRFTGKVIQRVRQIWKEMAAELRAQEN